MEIDTLFAISPVDGRYRNITEEISKYYSEYAYIKYRVMIEVKWLQCILKNKKIVGVEDNLEILDDIYNSFDVKEAIRVKEIESTTNHDVKSIEYYVRESLKKYNLDKYESFVHFACTSEDINNAAISLMIKDTLENVVIPSMQSLISSVKAIAEKYESMPMLAHTHGQPATPTTVGKELAVFVYRWEYILEKIRNIQLKGKFSGAVGTFAAHKIAYDNVDWIELSKDFLNLLNLSFNPLTTQIESHDTICELFSYIKLFNNITLDFDSDMWIYISNRYFKQKVVETETGSSVMPHKVNPINYENSIANIHMANSIIDNFTNNLQISRMQRDLSDSSNMRNIGVMFAHTLISLKQTLKGVNRVEVNAKVITQELDENPEVLAEAIQTILRKNGYNNAYELLKSLTRGKEISLKDIKDFVFSLDIDEKDKEKLMNLSPADYTGLASKLVNYIK